MLKSPLLLGLLAFTLIITLPVEAGDENLGQDSSFLFDGDKTTVWRGSAKRSEVTFESTDCFNQLTLFPVSTLQRVWVHQLQHGKWTLLNSRFFDCNEPQEVLPVAVEGEACQGTVRMVFQSCSDTPSLKEVELNKVESKSKRALEEQQIACSTAADCSNNVIYTACLGGSCSLPICYTHADCVDPSNPMCNFDPVNPTCTTGCVINEDCNHIPLYPYCDKNMGTCSRGECLTTSDCTDPSFPVCDVDLGICSVGCTSFDDCAHLYPNFWCDFNSTSSTFGYCVEPVCFGGQFVSGYDKPCADDRICSLSLGLSFAALPRCVNCTNNVQCWNEYGNSLPYCNAGTCTEWPCLNHDDCTSTTASRCNPSTRICEGCQENSECADKFSFATYCDIGGECVAPECLETDDCPDPTAARCDTSTQQCTDCQDNTDCRHLRPDGLSTPYVCDFISGDCVPGCFENSDCTDPNNSRCYFDMFQLGYCDNCQNDYDCTHIGRDYFCDEGDCRLSCVDNDDCRSRGNSRCYTNDGPAYCDDCITNDDCAHLSEDPSDIGVFLYCDEGDCVDPYCISNDDCLTPDAPTCSWPQNADTNRPDCYAGCTSDDDCTKFAVETSCNTASGECVSGCNSNLDCRDPNYPVCTRGSNGVYSCTANCTSDADCAHFPFQAACVKGDFPTGLFGPSLSIDPGTCAPLCDTDARNASNGLAWFANKVLCTCAENDDCQNPGFPRCSLPENTTNPEIGWDQQFRRCSMDCYRSPNHTACEQFSENVWCVSFDVAGTDVFNDFYGTCIVPECLSDDDCTRPGFPYCDLNSKSLPPGPRCVRACNLAALPGRPETQHNGCAHFAHNTYCAPNGACVRPECHTNLDCSSAARPYCDLNHPSGKPTCVPQCTSNDDCAQFVQQVWCDQEVGSSTLGQCVSPKCFPYRQEDSITNSYGISSLCRNPDTPVCDLSTGLPRCVANCTTDDHCVQFTHRTTCWEDGTCQQICHTNEDCLDPMLPICLNYACASGCTNNNGCAQFTIESYCNVTSGTCHQPECITNRECTDPTKPSCLLAPVGAIPVCTNFCDDDDDCSQFVVTTACNASSGECYEPACSENSDCKDHTKPTCNVCVLIAGTYTCSNGTATPMNQCYAGCNHNDNCSHFQQWEACDAVRGMCTVPGDAGTPCYENDDCFDPTRPVCQINAMDPSLNLCVAGCMTNEDCERFATPPPGMQYGFNYCDRNIGGGQCVSPECWDNNDCLDPALPVCIFPLSANVGHPQCLNSCNHYDNCTHFSYETSCDFASGRCVASLCEEDNDCIDPLRPTCSNATNPSGIHRCFADCDDNDDCTRFELEIWCGTTDPLLGYWCFDPDCTSNWDCLNPATPICDMDDDFPTCTTGCTSDQDCVQFATILGPSSDKYGYIWCAPNGQCVQPRCQEQRDCLAPSAPVCDLSSNPPSCSVGCNDDDNCTQFTSHTSCVGGVCVVPDCTSDEDCTDPDNPVCDFSLDPPACVAGCVDDDDCHNFVDAIICKRTGPTAGSCVVPECEENDDCPSSALPHCNLAADPPTCTNLCVDDDECSHFAFAKACVAGVCTFPGECNRDSDCLVNSPSRPACWVGNYTCVECFLDVHCSGATPACNTHEHKCRECNDDWDCRNPATPACSAATHTCVECVDDRDCTSPDAPSCDYTNNVCVECTKDDDCDGACIVNERRCVECTDNSHCADNQNLTACNFNSNACVECNTNLDCAKNPLLKTCDPAYHVCVRCLSDADCRLPSSSPFKACNPTAQICVECSTDSHCTDPSRPACDVTANVCVECTSDTHCDATCDVSSQTCLQCSTDEHCENYPGTPACDAGLGICVACRTSEHCTSALAPACDVATSTCVRCSADEHCGGATPACNAAARECVECTTNDHCSEGVCDITSNTCVRCLSHGDCGGDKPYCDTRGVEKCVGCLEDNHCPTSKNPMCNLDTQECAECTVSSDCWLRDASKPICAKGKCRPCHNDRECVGNFLYYQACDKSSGVCTADQYKKGFYISAIILGSVAVFLVTGALIAVVVGAAAK